MLQVQGAVVLLMLAACGSDSKTNGGGANCGADCQTEDGGADGGTGATGAGDGGASTTGGGGESDGSVPVPTGEWKNVTANLANMASECGNMSLISAKPDEDMLIAGIAQKGLWQSTNGGKSWTALGGGQGSAQIINRPSAIVYDPDEPKRFWESGIYNSFGVYVTSDNGDTFAALGDAMHSDLVSVDLSDPDRKTLLAGGHEGPQKMLLSTDGGGTWTNIGTALPADKSCTWPLVIDANTMLVGCNYMGEGIYRSTDTGKTWKSVSDIGGSGAPLRASDDSIYWPVGGNNGMMRSTDDGKTWQQVTSGYGTVTSVQPIELPDGRIATLSSESVVASSDHGATWQPVSVKLPYSDANTLIYSTFQKAFFIRHFTCTDTVPADGIMRYDYTVD